jgi:glycosyltransferase involved in cell wall biosynthesis
MDKPEISVILPFYNAQLTISRAIESIIDQTIASWELLLVDNGSTDKSSAIACLFAKSDARIRILEAKQRGVVFAFNTGLRHASGTYIARMDADDFCHPNRLEKQLDYLQKNSEVAAVSSQVQYCARVPQEGMQDYVTWVNSLTTPKQIKNNRFVELPVINPSLTFRRTDLDKWGSYIAGNFPEDYELVLRWLAQGAVFSKVDNLVLDWHDSAQRLTRTDARYSTEAFFRIKTIFLAEWLQKHNPFHPDVVVWGAGRKTRQRARLLETEGVSITAYIDIVPNKTKEHPCIYYQDIAPPGQYFILSYVSNRGQRTKIRDFLLTKGYQEAVDFLLVA